MRAFSWLDNRTLIACDFMMAIAFSIVFFTMKKTYPALRGINTIAVSFLLGAPGASLLASHGYIPRFMSITVAYTFVFSSFIFLYRGILRFLGSRKTAFVPVIVSCIALVVLFYFSQIQENVVPRIIAISVTIGLVRGLIALELFRKSPTSPSPRTMRIFAASMSFFAAATVNCGMGAMISNRPSSLIETNFAVTTGVFLGVISVCVTGLFVLILSSNELIARSYDESQKDSLSGAFNRRGIEAKLQAELKHVYRGKQKLSIALIDLDYFKAINDVAGHAAGDAALRDVAETITRHLRGRDYLGRYGGDEFLLILPQTGCNVAVGVAERLNQAVTKVTRASGIPPLTLSIGLTEAVITDDAVTLIARADKALYQAKSDGRNCRRLVTADLITEPQIPLRPILIHPPKTSLLQ